MGSNGMPSAANESKDAITERIIHTVNMMKEVLQSNLNLRETIQKQSEMIDNLNADMFQMQSENEDLRDRIQILEEYTGKDSYSDMTKLVKEKKVLENRVKHLEQTSMNWAQFQATRQNFHQQKDKVNHSQIGLIPKATLNNEFNDDYEPVRCAMNPSDAYSQDVQAGKKKKKLYQINYQAQFNKGKNSMPNGDANIPNSSLRHQEYKIRTVKSLANAYQQATQNTQQQFRAKIPFQAQSTKNNLYNQSQPQFSNHPGGGNHYMHHNMNQTNYDRQRNSIGFSNSRGGGMHQPFNGNNTQEYKNQYKHQHQQYLEEDDYEDDGVCPGNKSPQIRATKKVSNMQMQNDERFSYTNQQQCMQKDIVSVDYIPQRSYTRERSTLPLRGNIQLKMKKEFQHQQMRPPQSQENKYANSYQQQRLPDTNNHNSSQRERMNASADYINNQSNPGTKSNPVDSTQFTYGEEEDPNSSFYQNPPFGGDDQDEEYYNELDDGQLDRNNDAYEALRQQQLKNISRQQNVRINSVNGFGQLDVSLPKIRQQ